MESRFKAMVFDMDGTLLNSMWYWRTMWREYIEAHGLPVPEELKDAVLSGCGRACELIARDTGLDRRAIYHGMLEEMLARHYREDVNPKPFAAEVLDRFRREGFAVAVATATPRHLAEPALARHGLLEKLDSVTDTEEMASAKGDGQFFLNVAGRLGVKPSECVMFEDAVYAIRAAKQAGMAVVAIDEPISAPDREEIHALADRYIMGWDEMLRIPVEAIAGNQ